MKTSNKQWLASVLLIGAVSIADLCAQIPGACAVEQREKLACMVPSIIGKALPPEFLQRIDFATIATGNSVLISPLTTSVPLPTPASGFTYRLDPETGLRVPEPGSYGPNLAERAETIGKNRLSAGYAFRRYTFDQVDGLDLQNLPILTSFGGDFKLVFHLRENVKMTLNQHTLFGNFGLTDNTDVSVGVPFNDISGSISLLANLVDAAVPLPGISSPSTPVSASSSASGLGDITVQVKTLISKRERMGIAVGALARTPTGDEFNGLGAGAWGVRPFIAASYDKRIFSPHVNAAFEWNGESVVMGNIFTGETRNIPNQIIYAAGFDSGVYRHLTLNFDFVGRHMIGADRYVLRTQTLRSGLPVTGATIERSSIDIADGAFGFKFNPFGNFLVGGNVLFKLNNGGFRDNVSPMITFSYSP